MKITAYLSREGEQIMAARSNREDKMLVLGICNDLTNHLLSIVVHPDGNLTCTHHKVGETPDTVWELGRVFEAGMVELHEPKLVRT